jgi:hypothetical protein
MAMESLKMEHVEQRVHIIMPELKVDGFKITIPPWQFRCGRRNPELATVVDFPETVLNFSQAAKRKKAVVYANPSIVTKNENINVDSHYLVKEWEEGTKKSALPAERFLDRNGRPIEPIWLLDLTMPGLGEGESFEKVLINHEDQNWTPEITEIETEAGTLKRFLKTQIPPGWERLSAKKHANAFPLKRGFSTPAKEEEVTCIKPL